MMVIAVASKTSLIFSYNVKKRWRRYSQWGTLTQQKLSALFAANFLLTLLWNGAGMFMFKSKKIITFSAFMNFVREEADLQMTPSHLMPWKQKARRLVLRRSGDGRTSQRRRTIVIWAPIHLWHQALHTPVTLPHWQNHLQIKQIRPAPLQWSACPCQVQQISQEFSRWTHWIYSQ